MKIIKINNCPVCDCNATDLIKLDKYPLTEIYQIFGKQDWAYYLLSQIFVIASFYIVWNFSKDFFKNAICKFSHNFRVFRIAKI